MNAKTCKLLRRIARALTVGEPERAWVVKDMGQRARMVNGKPMAFNVGIAIQRPGTTRHVYRSMKRHVHQLPQRAQNRLARAAACAVAFAPAQHAPA